MSSDPATLRGLDAEKHLADPVLKQHYVTTMFEIIAPCYDRFTRTFSLGKDVGWKRELLDLARGQLPRGARVLDLACGSGDLALGLAADTDGVRSTGVDVSRNRIAIAERRRRDEQTLDATFTLGTMVQLPVSRASIDAVTVGYGLRNAPGLGAALDEIERVLKPGGRLYCLDFFKPKPTFWRTVWLGYLAALAVARRSGCLRVHSAVHQAFRVLARVVRGAGGASLRGRGDAAEDVRRNLPGGGVQIATA
jgi:demethylmenaquinone methyltransferase/2-methoxy-6-polyprenyl-1,4-benzoquinol methylase